MYMRQDHRNISRSHFGKLLSFQTIAYRTVHAYTSLDNIPVEI